MSILKSIVGSLRRDGIRGTLAQAGPFLSYLARGWYPMRVYRRDEAAEGFDDRYGTDTTAIVEPWNLSSIEAHPLVRAREITVYSATSAMTFQSMLARIDLPWKELVFIDLGSGKGRTLLLASELPFRRIVGVEFARELHEVALRNVAIYRSPTQRCSAFDLSCMDAAAYRFPEDHLFLYLANPFGGTLVLPQVLHHLAASLVAHPREVYVLYANPLKRPGLDELMAVAGLVKVRTSREPMRLAADGWWTLFASPAGAERLGLAPENREE
jgi:SAM-dependent methyltransferase